MVLRRGSTPNKGLLQHSFVLCNEEGLSWSSMWIEDMGTEVDLLFPEGARWGQCLTADVPQSAKTDFCRVSLLTDVLQEFSRSTVIAKTDVLISKLKQFFLINCSSLVHSHSLWENLVFMSQMHCRHLSIVGSLRKRVCLTHLCIHKIHMIFIHSRGFIYIYTYAGMDEM